MENSLDYDAENRQVRATDTSNGAIERYFYDGNGQRVEKSGPSGTTTYVYDALGRLAAEYGPPSTAPCTTCYFTYDHLGSVRLVTDQNGSVVARHDYLPFGEEFVRGGQFGANDGVNQKFTGKERDQETELDYFGARYFSAAQGRFTSPDWSEKPEPVPYADFNDPQTLNLYIYGRNNPLKNRDYDGHCDVDGEHHNWFWCLGHTFGFKETAKETQKRKAAWEEYNRQWLQAMRQPGYVVTSTIPFGMAAQMGTVNAALTEAAAMDAAATEAGVAGESGTAVPGWTRVGRWMSTEELAKMQSTGVAQESTNLGGSRVALPSNADAYKAAPAGTVYVEYDIPAGVAKPAGSGWARIPGPNSVEGRAASAAGRPAPEMPPVKTSPW